MNKIFKIALVAAVAAVAGYGVYANQNEKAMSDLMLANVEALAGSNEGYVIGPIGTNWKTYRITCVRTVGFDYIIVDTTTTTYEADVCGKGSGTCLSPAGC
ncbi:NVEALA domain-containing protein [uncultured Bacteroides sp.]|uniref:NVEALA domain-containing protein n=1 Tax=uncultured Bacteroides sp. TaxID=162156 RepID=UPI0027337C89|nr:NVEALA domain-containing protein [uncultured Bacteroides sp.]